MHDAREGYFYTNGLFLLIFACCLYLLFSLIACLHAFCFIFFFILTWIKRRLFLCRWVISINFCKLFVTVFFTSCMFAEMSLICFLQEVCVIASYFFYIYVEFFSFKCFFNVLGFCMHLKQCFMHVKILGQVSYLAEKKVAKNWPAPAEKTSSFETNCQNLNYFRGW